MSHSRDGWSCGDRGFHSVSTFNVGSTLVYGHPSRWLRCQVDLAKWIGFVHSSTNQTEKRRCHGAVDDVSLACSYTLMAISVAAKRKATDILLVLDHLIIDAHLSKEQHHRLRHYHHHHRRRAAVTSFQRLGGMLARNIRHLSSFALSISMKNRGLPRTGQKRNQPTTKERRRQPQQYRCRYQTLKWYAVTLECPCMLLHGIVLAGRRNSLFDAGWFACLGATDGRASIPTAWSF